MYRQCPEGTGGVATALAKDGRETEAFSRLLRMDLVIQDNGKGFDPRAGTRDRNGLANMTDRMRELDGTCVLTSRPGGGCRIELALALKPSRRRSFGWTSKPNQAPALTDETKGEQHSNEILEANDTGRQ